MALALGARLLTCVFDFQRSVARDRSSHQFSASPTLPCKSQAAPGLILVVLRDLLGAWCEPDAMSPRPIVNLEKANEHEPDRCRRHIPRRQSRPSVPERVFQ